MIAFTDLLFYLFALLLLGASTMVIVSRDAVYAVLYLIFSFFTAAALMVLIGAEFLAMILVIVYVGAVAVLFLFVVMMLGDQMKQKFIKNWPLAVILGLILAGEMILLMFYDLDSVQGYGFKEAVSSVPNTHQIGALLYTHYFHAFQLTGVVLLVAMVAAITLTLRKRPGVRRQDILTQLKREPRDTLRMTDPEIGKGVDV